jgi:hypothetical protein
MRRFAHFAAIAAMLVVASGSAADAGTKKAHTAKKAAAPKCSKCKMTLSAKKTATMNAAVKIGKKTWWCCSACGAHKKASAGKKAPSEL